MHQQSGLPFYRLVTTTVVAFAFILFVAILINAFSSNQAFAVTSSSSGNLFDTSDMSDSPNIITAGAARITTSTKQVLGSTGTMFQGGTQSMTATLAQGGRAVTHSSAVIAGGAWHGSTVVGRALGAGTMFGLRGVASGIVFTIRIPAKLLGSIAAVPPAHTIIRPADSAPTPKITADLPTAIMARVAQQAKQNSRDQQKATELFQSQLTANENLGGSIIAGDPTHGGYPAKWDAPTRQDSRLDSWGLYNRECVSYTAWKVYQTFGHMPYWGGVGNANEWPADARRGGIPTGSTPRVHAVAVSLHGYYGHTMWVEAVKGSMIYVSQYNYHLDGHYSEMWVDGSSFTYLYFQ